MYSQMPAVSCSLIHNETADSNHIRSLSDTTEPRPVLNLSQRRGGPPPLARASCSSSFMLRPIGQTALTTVYCVPALVRPTAAYGRPVLTACHTTQAPVAAVRSRSYGDSCIAQSVCSAWKPLGRSVDATGTATIPPLAEGKVDYGGRPDSTGSCKSTSRSVIMSRSEPHTVSPYSGGRCAAVSGGTVDSTGRASLSVNKTGAASEVPGQSSTAVVSAGQPRRNVQSSPPQPNHMEHYMTHSSTNSANRPLQCAGNDLREARGQSTNGISYSYEPRPEPYGKASTPRCTPLSSITREEAGREHKCKSHQHGRNLENDFKKIYPPIQTGPLPNQADYCPGGTSISGTDEVALSFSSWLSSHLRLIFATCLPQPYRTGKPLAPVPWTLGHLERVVRDRFPGLRRPAVQHQQLQQLSGQLQLLVARVADVAGRLCSRVPVCSGRVILTAAQMSLAAPLAAGCAAVCHTAALLHGGGSHLHLARGARAGLQLDVGRLHRWLCENIPHCLIHELASVYLTAVIEHVLELMMRSWLSHCQQVDSDKGLQTRWCSRSYGYAIEKMHKSKSLELLTPTGLSNYELTASLASQLCQLCCHLTSTESAQSPETKLLQAGCVKDAASLSQLIERLQRRPVLGALGSQRQTGAAECDRHGAVKWSPNAVTTLAYFTTCSQPACDCSNGDDRGGQTLTNTNSSGQRLSSQPHPADQNRPPLSDWLRVCLLLADHWRETEVLEEHVTQTARLLLTTAECPPPVWSVNNFRCVSSSRRACGEVVFGAVANGSTSLLTPALQYTSDQCGVRAVDIMCARGMTPLMVSCLLGHEPMSRRLIHDSAIINCKTPAVGSALYPAVVVECQHWTALTYAVASGSLQCVSCLLENGASVDPNEPEQPAITPLQLAVGMANEKMVSLLLNHGADPFVTSSLSQSPTLPGSYAAVVVAAARGDTATLMKLLRHHRSSPSHQQQTMSLTEALVDIDAATRNCTRPTSADVGAVRRQASVRGDQVCSAAAAAAAVLSQLGRSQLRQLQEAAYQAAEAGFYETALSLNSLGVPWPMHTWLQLLHWAHTGQQRHLLGKLLTQFDPAGCTRHELRQIGRRGVPLLFDTLRHNFSVEFCQSSAAIISACYCLTENRLDRKLPDCLANTSSLSTSCTPTSVAPPTMSPSSTPAPLAHAPFHSSTTPTYHSPSIPSVSPNFVAVDHFNCPDLADVVFHVQGGRLYGHRLLLVDASAHFRQLLSADKCGRQKTPPVHVHLENVHYSVFELLLRHLYDSDWSAIYIGNHDLIELLVAASSFQLSALFAHVQQKCLALVDVFTVLPIYHKALSCNAEQLVAGCEQLMLRKLPQLITLEQFRRSICFPQQNGHSIIDSLQYRLQYCLQHCDQ